MSILVLVSLARADPITLPEVTAYPLEPTVSVDQGTQERAPVLGPLVRFHEELHDPGPVTMLLSTVDEPPVLLVADAADASEAESCTLRVTVNREGRVVRPRVVQCDAPRRAKRRARAMAFAPARYDGRPVAVSGVPLSVRGGPKN
ncbi:MAG: hypothetical protein AAF211_16385 [Myxococcota bacterium]